MECIFDGNSSHELFLQLKNSDEPFYPEKREHIKRLWERFEPFAEKGFIDNFGKKPSPGYWEMAVGCFLLDCGLSLSSEWAQRGNTKGPDFLVENVDGKRLWVECTTCGLGEDENDNIPQRENYLDTLDLEREEEGAWSYICGQHLRQIKLRVATRFEGKIEHMQRSIDNPTCEPKVDDYFVVAIGGGEIPSVIWNDNITDDLGIVSLFAPIRDTNLIDLKNGRILEKESKTNKIGSQTTTTVEKPFMLKDENKEIDNNIISHILFSKSSISSNSSAWNSNFYSLNNYNALQPLPDGLFSEARNLSLKWVDDILQIRIPE